LNITSVTCSTQYAPMEIFCSFIVDCEEFSQ
jgi:hypothetical protein